MRQRLRVVRDAERGDENHREDGREGKPDAHESVAQQRVFEGVGERDCQDSQDEGFSFFTAFMEVSVR